MALHLEIVGGLLVALALVHPVFPFYFDWKNELSGLRLINRQLVYVHMFFIALMVLLMGVLCLTSAPELVETRLGRKVLLGMLVFWALRLVVQFFGYSSKLWKGKRFETAVHVLFSLLWGYVSLVFLLAAWPK